MQERAILALLALALLVELARHDGHAVVPPLLPRVALPALSLAARVVAVLLLPAVVRPLARVRLILILVVERLRRGVRMLLLALRDLGEDVAEVRLGLDGWGGGVRLRRRVLLLLIEEAQSGLDRRVDLRLLRWRSRSLGVLAEDGFQTRLSRLGGLHHWRRLRLVAVKHLEEGADVGCALHARHRRTLLVDGLALFASEFSIAHLGEISHFRLTHVFACLDMTDLHLLGQLPKGLFLGWLP